MNPDSYWNIDNMIYDNGKISVANILQSSNLYNYCMGNPIKFYDKLGNLVTEADYEAYDNDLITSEQIQIIADAGYRHDECEINKDYAGMNKARKDAVAVRKIYDPDYVDDYDYTHGGKCYSDGTLVVSPEPKREKSAAEIMIAGASVVIPATFDAYFSGDFQNTEDYTIGSTNTLEEYALETAATPTPYPYDDLSDIEYDNKKQNGQMGR